MVALERLLLLSVALLELLLLDHMGARVVFFLSVPLLLEVLHFPVVLLVHRRKLVGVLLFGVDLLLWFCACARSSAFNSALCRFCMAWSCSVC